MFQEYTKANDEMPNEDELKLALSPTLKEPSKFICNFLKENGRTATMEAIFELLKQRFVTEDESKKAKYAAKLKVIEDDYGDLMNEPLNKEFNKEDFLKTAFLQYVLYAYYQDTILSQLIHLPATALMAKTIRFYLDLKEVDLYQQQRHDIFKWLEDELEVQQFAVFTALVQQMVQQLDIDEMFAHCNVETMSFERNEMAMFDFLVNSISCFFEDESDAVHSVNAYNSFQGICDFVEQSIFAQNEHLLKALNQIQQTLIPQVTVQRVLDQYAYLEVAMKLKAPNIKYRVSGSGVQPQSVEEEKRSDGVSLTISDLEYRIQHNLEIHAEVNGLRFPMMQRVQFESGKDVIRGVTVSAGSVSAEVSVDIDDDCKDITEYEMEYRALNSEEKEQKEEILSFT